MDDKTAISVVLFGIFVAIGMSFYLGEMYERQKWHKVLPDQVQQLCDDCYKQGHDDALPPQFTKYQGE